MLLLASNPLRGTKDISDTARDPVRYDSRFEMLSCRFSPPPAIRFGTIRASRSAP